MHLIRNVIWQLKTIYRKTMPFVLAMVAKSCYLRGDYQCWMLFWSSILSSNTVNLRMTIMDQRVVPMCEAQAWCPVSSAPVFWASISDVDTDIFFFPAIPSKHSKVFSLQISRRCGCISCTRTMNFLQWRLQHSTSQLLQSSKETFSVKNEGFVSLPWFSPSWNIYPYGFLS